MTLSAYDFVPWLRLLKVYVSWYNDSFFYNLYKKISNRVMLHDKVNNKKKYTFISCMETHSWCGPKAYIEAETIKNKKKKIRYFEQ